MYSNVSFSLSLSINAYSFYGWYEKKNLSFLLGVKKPFFDSAAFSTVLPLGPLQRFGDNAAY